MTSHCLANRTKIALTTHIHCKCKAGSSYAKPAIFLVRGTVTCNRQPLLIPSYYARVRYSSTNRGDGYNEDQLSYWKRFKAWAQPFVNGAKLLYGDVKKSRELSKRQSQGRLLTRSELLHLRRTKSDVLRSLPLVAFFILVPWVGYIAPVIGYKYPKLLLSRQFWTDEQERQFREEDFSDRAAGYKSLMSFLEVSDDIRHAIDRARKGENISGPELKALERYFATGNQFALSSLSREHLLALSQAVLIPRWQFAVVLLPNVILRSMLRQHGYDISDDDIMLAKEGFESLSEDELVDACNERGLDFNSRTFEELKAMMDDWLSVYAISSAPGALPPSLTLHAATFKQRNAAKLVED